MMLELSLLVLILLAPSVLPASFPLTAISGYTFLAPCAASHLSFGLDTWFYDGCSSATPISAYGSCICAQRLSSIQRELSIDFGADTECSTSGVQPFLTAFCDKWGVDIGAVAAGGGGTGTATAANEVATGGGATGGGLLLSDHIPSETTDCGALQQQHPGSSQMKDSQQQPLHRRLHPLLQAIPQVATPIIR